MSGKQRAILWMGLILVVLNLLSHWKDFKSLIFTGSGGSSGGGGINIPNPFQIIPIVPLGATATPTANKASTTSA